MRSGWLIAGCLSLIACGGRAPSATGSETESGEGSSGAGSTSATASGSDTQAPTDEGPEGGEPGPCEQDGDCGPGMLCVQGMCQTDCGHAEMIIETPEFPLAWVVDRSASMSALDWDHDGDSGTPALSRWAHAHDFVSTLAPMTEHLVHALSLYPSADACAASGPDCYDASACLSDSSPLHFGNDEAETLAQLLAQLPPPDAGPELIRGGSPTTEAMLRAADALAEVVARGGLGGLIILVSDGGSNCGPEDCNSNQDCPLLTELDPQLLDTVAQLNQAGTPTLVVAVDPVSDSTDPDNADAQLGPLTEHLNALAISGGMPQSGDTKYYTPEDISTIQGILNPGPEPGACELDLSTPPNSPPQPWQVDGIEFYFGQDETLIPHLEGITPEACESQSLEGWIWLEPGITLMACGASCDQLTEIGWEARLIYPCE